MVKIAYHLCFHKNFEQCLNLFESLYTPEDVFLLHVDKKAPGGLFEKMVEALQPAIRNGNVHFQHRLSVKWGTYTIIKMKYNGLRDLHRLDDSWTHYMNLSGQDYPLQPVRKIKSVLEEDQNVNYLEVKIDQEWDEIGRRLQRYCMPKMSGGFFHLRIPRPVPRDVEFYGGSVWCTLTRPFCEYVIESPESRRLMRHFRFTRNCAELFFQTLLMNSHFRDSLVNDDKHYIKWKQGTNGHPDILVWEDMEKLENTDKWFGRKFDWNVDKDVVLALRERVGLAGG